jgi:hypothetical protein
MTPSRVEQAARNNAIWCDTVCRAHGVPGEFHDALWINRHTVPRFYSNAVTLSDGRAKAAQLAHLQALLDSRLPGSWSVKDSFRELDLTALGFQVLFEATWLWRPASPAIPQSVPAGVRWNQVRNASELAQWETAWNDDPANTSSAPQPRLFLPALLADQRIAFLAAYQGQVIVAGAIANRTGDVVGLSNVFVPKAEDRAWFWADCIAAIQDRFPGLPLVSYQRGPELALAQTVGFEPLQDLSVWIRQA